MQTEDPLAIGEVIEVELPRTGVHHIEIVWNSGSFFGCRFLEPVPPAAVSAALLKSSPEGPAQHPVSEEPSSFRVNLGTRLAAMRTKRGWTIETLAERLGVSRQAVWYWETGQRLPRAEHFETIIEVLGLQEQDLLGHAPPSEPSTRAASIDELKREIARQIGVEEATIRIVIEL